MIFFGSLVMTLFLIGIVGFAFLALWVLVEIITVNRDGDGRYMR
jgi:hypothetical protein